MKKRQLAVSVAGILLAVSLAGCSGSGTAETSMPQAEAGTEASEADGAGGTASAEAGSLTVNGGAQIPLASLEHRTESADAPEV